MRELAITAVTILRKARERITPRERWCQGPQAQDVTGAPADARGQSAVAWCAMGVLTAALGYDGPRDYLVDQLDRATARGSIVGVNEGIGDWTDCPARAHRNVLAAYDKAIARLCKQWAIPLLLLLTLAAPAHADELPAGVVERVEQLNTVNRARLIVRRDELVVQQRGIVRELESIERDLLKLEGREDQRREIGSWLLPKVIGDGTGAGR
jgi:hypothetical protein